MSVSNVLSKDRIILHYPSILAEDEARSFVDRENKALQLVEEFLQVQYRGQVTIHIKITPFREHYAKADGIYYSFSGLDLQRLSGKGNTLAVGNLHELVHFVAQELLSPIKRSEPPGFFLVEGLAMAIDAIANPKEAIHLHLIAKGLLLLGVIKPVLQIMPTDPPFLRYEVAGSFTHFLLKQHSLEKLTELYTFINQSDFNKATVRIYGTSIRTLEQEWQRFLADCLPKVEERARYAALASLELNHLSNLPILRYGNQWFRQGLIGDASEALYAQDMALYEALSALTGEEPSSQSEEDDYELFQTRLEVYRSLLRKWHNAAMAFREARQLLIAHDTNYDLLLTLVKQAYTYFQELNDVTMMSKTRLYSALILSMKADKVLNGNHDKATKFLQDAEAFLSCDTPVL